MQQDTIERPASTRSDELVPSRYALRVGDIEAMVISDGVLPLPTETMSTNVDTASREAWFKSMFVGPEMFDWGLNVLVVRSGDQIILVDSGIGDQFEGFPRAGQLEHRLGAAGIEIESITDVVLTHMHMDHIGGLLGEGVKSRLRADLRIHVAAKEVEFWKAPDFSQTDMPDPVPQVLRSTSKKFMTEYHNRLVTFDEKHEVAPGVFVQRTGGHTPGHSIVRLVSKGERLTFAGDALFPVAFDHPDWQNGFEHAPEEAVKVRVHLMEEVAATRELLVATHMPFPSLGHVAVDGDRFRWVPAFWDY